MDDGAPLLRVSTLQSALEGLRALPFADQALPRVDVRIIEAIDQSARTKLLPAEYGLALTAAVHEVTGDRGVIELNRHIVNQANDIPLFRPLLRGALNLFGSGPKGLMNGLRTGVKASGRNTPVVSHEDTGEKSVRSIWAEIPRPLREHSWLVANVGTLHGLLDLAGVEGEVVYDDSRFVSEGVAVYDMTWR